VLRRLEIENFGLIASARVEFADGATIFTGETGSGKTMLVGALGFALGARMGSDTVRRGASKATVTLAFDPGDDVRARLAADGYELDAGEEATVTRETSDSGRSLVRLCGRPSTAAYVRELAASVAEIAGQHEAQRLLAPAYHQELLDRFGGAAAERARVAVETAYRRLAEIGEALERMRGDERRARERYDDAVFAAREIETARPRAGEETELQDRRRYLENLQRVADALERARSVLTDDGGAIGALGDAAAALRTIADVSAAFQAMGEQASALQSQANDVAAAVAGAAETGELDPGELDVINTRLEILDNLKRKYGDSLERVLAHAETAHAIANDFETRDAQIAELVTLQADGRVALQAAAARLTAVRKRSAAALIERVTAELGELALGSGRFDVAFEVLERCGPEGAERIEFLFSANAGEPMRPLARIASGGELSRMLLALVVALADARDSSAALVFDEIDAGVGGATGAAVGARIGRLGRNGQVVCITHLAQLASWADRHYVLDKSERAGMTAISVREVSGDAARVSELARMLSGETHDAALKHARTLLRKRAVRNET